MTETLPQTRGEWTSASNAEADSLCAGRHLMQRGMPDIKTEDSIHGAGVHAALAAQNPKGLDTEQEETYDACNAIEKKLVEQYFGKSEVDKALMVSSREKRFWIKWPDGLEHSGQIDSVYRSGTKALIIEYKALQGAIPSSPTNMQLRDQAVLFWVNSPLLTDIATAVVQPLVTHTPLICNYKKEHIERAVTELYARVKASNDPKSPRTAGEVQCKWCRAKTKCPEHTKFASSLVVTKEDTFMLGIPPSEWTPLMRTAFMERASIAEKWLEDCKLEMKRLLKENPAAVPGYELKPNPPRATITNPQDVFNRFLAAGGNSNQFLEAVSVTKGKLKEVVKTVTNLKGKKLDEAVEGVIGENFTMTEIEPTITKKKQ